METEVKLLEAETFSSLLKEEAEKGDTNAIQELWQSVPDHVQDDAWNFGDIFCSYD